MQNQLLGISLSCKGKEDKASDLARNIELEKRF
jgi:hypothetical protein